MLKDQAGVMNSFEKNVDFSFCVQPHFILFLFFRFLIFRKNAFSAFLKGLGGLVGRFPVEWWHRRLLGWNFDPK